MKKNNRLIKVVNLAVEQSFEKDKLSIKNVNLMVKSFKKLAATDAVFTLNQYLKGLKRKVLEKTLVIESATKLSSQELKNIEKTFSKTTKILAVKNKIDPSLLGGIKVKIGDIVYDNSLTRKIKQVGEAIRS